MGLQPFRSSTSSNLSGFTQSFGSELTLSADGGLLAHSRVSIDFDFTEGLNRIDADVVVTAADGAAFGVGCAGAGDSCTYRYRSENDFERIGDFGDDLVFSVVDTIADFGGSASAVLGPSESDEFLEPPAIQAPGVSADGTTLAFERADQIIVVDLVAGAQAIPRIASTAQAAPLPLGVGGGGSGTSSSPTLSGDGALIAFVSTAPDLLNAAGSARKGKGRKGAEVDVEGTQVLLKNLDSGQLSLISADQRGQPGDGTSGAPQMSGDGRFVVFESEADNLVRRDDNGVRDVFLKDLKSGRVTLISADRRNDPGNGPSGEPSLALDGRFVAFTSSADDLVADDLNGTSDVFVKDLKNGQIRLASVDTDGEQVGGSGGSISGDGRYVVFLSNADGFPTGDGSLVANAFVKDMTTGALARLDVGAVNLIANTVLEVSVGTVEISADGTTIAFHEAGRNLSVAPGLGDEESAAAGEAIGEVLNRDPLFRSRETIGITTNPFLDGLGEGASLLLDDAPAFDLARLLPGATGLSNGATEALTLQDGGPAGLHLPLDPAVMF